jgi:hypothetical protein
MYLNIDPYDPLGQYFWNQPPDADFDEPKAFRRALRFAVTLIAVIIALLALTSLFSSCTVTRETTSTVDSHKVETMIDRMDSLMRLKTVKESDSLWRETILRQFQSIREKSDTSRTQVVDSAGRVVREKIIINIVRETTSEIDRREFQKLTHRLESMDSTMRVMQQQLSHSDSLLQQRDTVREKEVPARLSWWQQARIWLGNVCLVVVLIGAAVCLLRKRTWWLALLRKLS